MIQLPEISTTIRKHKHNKKKSAQVLIAQLRDYHTYITHLILVTLTFDTPLKWWQTCEAKPPYLKQLAIKLFSVSLHAANCKYDWSVCGWIHGTRRTKFW